MPQGQVGQVMSGGRAGVHGTLAGFGLLARLPGCPSFRSGPSGSGYTPLHPTVRIATGGTAPGAGLAGFSDCRCHPSVAYRYSGTAATLALRVHLPLT